MAEGQVYVEVDASVVNGGIAPMAMVSSNPVPSEGQTYIVVWLLWRYDTDDGEGGFTGISWYFEDSNNVLKEKYGTEENFKNYLTGDNPPNLDEVLQDWDAGEKRDFLNAHKAELNSSCVYYM